VTRTPDPAAGPPSGRVAQAPVPGEPATSPPRVAGGKTSPRDVADGAAAGKPHPDPGAALGHEAAPGRGRAQAPAGEGRTGSVTPAGTSGAEWRKKVKAATSAKNAAQRRGRGRYTRVADRTAGDQYRPGMAVRKPPAGGEPDGAA